jgi:hypothetical protein
MKLEEVAKIVIDIAREHNIDLKSLDDAADGSFDREFDKLAEEFSSWSRDPDYHEELRDEVLAQIGADPRRSFGADLYSQIRGESVMKLTRNTLRQLIKEEKRRLQQEGFGDESQSWEIQIQRAVDGIISHEGIVVDLEGIHDQDHRLIRNLVVGVVSKYLDNLAR